MGCKTLDTDFFNFLEVIHRKKATEKFILGLSDGYVEPDGNGGYNYAYQYKDHLGNVRLSYADSDGNGLIDPNTEIISEKNYYPFGGLHKGYNNVVSANSNSVAQKFKFGGKELQDELGLEWYDVTARNYDPYLGRWMNIDPLAEQMRRHSPYNFGFNNPIYFQDYDGMSPSDVIITGDLSQEAFNELQASVADELLLSMDDDGNVTYTGTVIPGTLSEEAQQLVNAIDDNTVIVTVDTTDGHVATDNSGNSATFIGGAFLGSEKTGDTSEGESIITTSQIVNPEVTKKLDDANNNPGATLLHEVVESYLGGREAQSCGYSSVGPATGFNEVYLNAHQSAPEQGGKVYLEYVDSHGNNTGADLYRGGKEVFYTVVNGRRTNILEIQH